MKKINRWAVLSASLLILAAGTVEADSKTLDPLCPDAEVWSGKLITDICWGCLFPIRIAGGAMGSGDYPSSATDQVFCTCNDPNGIPDVGMTLGLWSPARMIELVTTERVTYGLPPQKFEPHRRQEGADDRGLFDKVKDIFG